MSNPSADPQSAFVTDKLNPRNAMGAPKERAYELNANSIHPTVIVGRDANGFPIEETRPPAYSRRFVHPDGGINWVPLRTGAVYSKDPSAERYELLQLKDLLSNGWIPLECCPFTNEYRHIVGGSFVTPRNGETDCGGDKRALDASIPDGSLGCEHLRAVVKNRLERSRERWQADQKRQDMLKTEDVKTLLQGVFDQVGVSGQQPVAPDVASRKRSMTLDHTKGT